MSQPRKEKVEDYKGSEANGIDEDQLLWQANGKIILNDQIRFSIALAKKTKGREEKKERNDSVFWQKDFRLSIV